MSYVIIRAEKLNTFGSIRASGQHNFRERDTPNADPARTAKNKHIGAQNTAELVAGIKARLPEKHRKDAVRCIEYFIGASPEYFGADWQQTGQYKTDYFNDALAWIKAKHGAQNVICSTLQIDETSPHLAVYVVPLTADGRLSAKEIIGNKKKLSQLQTDFAKDVGAKHGLERGIEGSKAKHRTVRQFYAGLTRNPRLKAPEAPLEPSMLEIATGKARAQLVEYADELRKHADLVEKAAATARLGEANRRAQAKAIVELREGKNKEIDRLQQENKQLQEKLTTYEADLMFASTDAAFWKGQAKKLEADFTKLKAGLVEMREHFVGVLPHLPAELRQRYAFLQKPQVRKPSAHRPVAVEREAERDADGGFDPSP